MSEETNQSTTSWNMNKRAKAKFFLSGVLVGIFLVVVLAFLDDPYLQEDYIDASIQDYDISEEYEESDQRDYPAWMDEYVDPPAGIEPRDVYTFSCELVLSKPTAFSTTCADFGIAIFEITWSKWSADGAKGKGVYSVNDCNPSCAEGTRHEVPVYLWLIDTTTDGKNYFLNTLRFVAKDAYEGKVNEIGSKHVNLNGEVVIEGKTFTGSEWDVSRNWKDFPQLRSDLPK